MLLFDAFLGVGCNVFWLILVVGFDSVFSCDLAFVGLIVAFTRGGCLLALYVNGLVFGGVGVLRSVDVCWV